MSTSSSLAEISRSITSSILIKEMFSLIQRPFYLAELPIEKFITRKRNDKIFAKA